LAAALHYHGRMEPITTILITHNEEANIDRCLGSVRDFSDEIIVVDSHSTDRTAELAARHGARVIPNDWPGYGRQKQFALEHAANEWIFWIDADEEVSPELVDEIRELDFALDGYEVRRLVRYCGRWIRHGPWYPGYVLRLFRKGRGGFTDDIVHERVRVSGSIGRLRGELLHYSYRDIAHHIEKINDLTTLAARQMFERKRRAGFLHIAVQPCFAFIKAYFIKGGFLDGLTGFSIAALHAHYARLKFMKLRELYLRSAENRAPSR
jgi:glycosyltransferase involved in cell wall biosynthesis